MALVVWSDSARADVHGIYNWIARDSVIRAQDWVHQLLDAPNRIALMPESGSPVEELPTTGLREFYVGKYHSISWHRHDVCCIVRVVHGSRGARRLLDPENLT